jgi:hypothetical protein
MLTEPARSSLGGDDPVLRIRMAVAVLAGEDRDGWTAAARSERLQELLEVRERLDAEVLRLVGGWDRDRSWELDGALSARSWLTRRTPVSASEAGRLVKNARLVDKQDEIGEALLDGDITVAHVDAIGRVVSKDREALLGEHAGLLVEQAKGLPVGDFVTVMRRWAALADDQLNKQDFSRRWERRHLHAAVGLDGWVTGDFYLDPVAGARLLGALDHQAPPDAADTPDGPRSLPQRRADALVDIIAGHVNGDSPAGNPPNINTVIDIAGLTGLTPDLVLAWCDIDGIGPVANTVLEQLCCDARFTRFITAGPSVILDMGRSTRLATPAQRRALAIRDRHCRFPGCNRQPQWCEAHHVDGWVESLGETNIDNLILLCRRHHTLIHNTKWTITRTNNGDFQFTHPARGP